MSRIRLVLLGLLAVLSVSAVASASASAAACTKAVNGKFVLCLNGELTEASKGITVSSPTGSSYVLKSAGIEVVCTVAKSSGGEVTSATGKTEDKKLVLEFSSCTVGAPAKCKVTEPIKTEKLKGNILKKEEIEFVGEGTNTFATIVLANNGGTCIVAGSLKVTGNPSGKGQVCTTPDIETSQASHSFKCAATGSHLKLGEEAATFAGTFNAALTEGGNWSVIEGT